MTASLLETYQALLSLSDRQRAALDIEALDDYLEATEERDAVFARLQSQEGEMAGLSPEQRATVRAIIPRILENDARIESRIDALTSQARTEISTLQTGLAALHTYIQQPENREAFFIDRNS